MEDEVALGISLVGDNSGKVLSTVYGLSRVSKFIIDFKDLKNIYLRTMSNPCLFAPNRKPSSGPPTSGRLK